MKFGLIAMASVAGVFPVAARRRASAAGRPAASIAASRSASLSSPLALTTRVVSPVAASG
jgi:hypothetical protein